MDAERLLPLYALQRSDGSGEALSRQHDWSHLALDLRQWMWNPIVLTKMSA
jgi:hypothetical protein